MFLKKLRENRHVNKNIKLPLHVIKHILTELRAKKDYLVICPTPTGENWLGVNIGTKSIFDNIVFEIPQYYSKPVYDDSEMNIITTYIHELSFTQVIFSGFCIYYAEIIKKIKEKHNIKTSIIFHGALSELAWDSEYFSLITKLFLSDKLDKIAFIKKDLNVFFNQLFSTDKSYNLSYKTNICKPDNISPEHEHNNIGVFAIHNFNKNSYNQVSAGMLIPDAKIHVLSKNSFSFLQNNDRIVVHPHMPHNAFMLLMASMTVNLHISFSESWGQIVTESLALGVPCLTSNNNGIFDYDDYLADKLIVNQYDNPVAIADRISEIIEIREELSIRGTEYIKKLNDISASKLEIFLNA